MDERMKRLHEAAISFSEVLRDFISALEEPEPAKETQKKDGIWGLTMVTCISQPELCLFTIKRMWDASNTEAWVHHSIAHGAGAGVGIGIGIGSKVIDAAQRFGIDSMRYDFVGWFASYGEAQVVAFSKQSAHNDSMRRRAAG